MSIHPLGKTYCTHGRSWCEICDTKIAPGHNAPFPKRNDLEEWNDKISLHKEGIWRDGNIIVAQKKEEGGPSFYRSAELTEDEFEKNA